MTKRRRIQVLAGVTALSFLPAVAYAGSGGTPPAPGASGAGQSTAYCCTASPPWTTRNIGGNGNNAVIIFDGHSCTVVTDPNTQCTTAGAQALKCRGEFFTPSTGSVVRCFSP